jgi:hemerythrin-like metal-binding protein
MATLTANVIFPWQAKYSVGIPQIDAQHQGLIKLINDLHAAMAAGQGKETAGKILDQLVRYTEVHFNYEEGMLRQKGYSQLTAHQATHKKLTAQVVELRERYKGGNITLSMEVMQFLKSWLADHIMGHDHKYADELNGK